jgi:putative FmdB family regulatory protein
MPKYDYKCDNCSITVEFERKIEEEIQPSCCNKPMTRQWSPVGVQFKGSGFYSTDNGK